MVQQYIGHERGDVLGDHYEKAGIERMRAEIVARIEEAMKVEETVQGDAGADERTTSDLH